MPPEEIWSFLWTTVVGAYVGHVEVWTAIEEAITEREKIKLWMKVDSTDVYGFTYPTVSAGFDYSAASYIAGLQQRVEDILEFNEEEQVNYWVDREATLDGLGYDDDIARLEFSDVRPDGWKRVRPYFLRDEDDPDYDDWPEDHDPPTDKIVRRLSDGMACEWNGSEWVPTATPRHSIISRRTLYGQCRADDYLSGHLIQDFIDALNEIIKVYFPFGEYGKHEIEDGQTWYDVDQTSADDAWNNLVASDDETKFGKIGIIAWGSGEDEPYAANAQAGSWKATVFSGTDSEDVLAQLPLDASIEWGGADDDADYVDEPDPSSGHGNIREMYEFDNNDDPIGFGEYETWTEAKSGGDEVISATKSSESLPNRPADPPEPDPITSGYIAAQSIKGYDVFGAVRIRAIINFLDGLKWAEEST